MTEKQISKQHAIIFCPQCANLILHETACAQCGWQRPLLGNKPGALLWQTQLPGTASPPYGQPATHDGLLFIANESGSGDGRHGTLYAITVASGATVWQQPFANRIARVLIVAEGRLLVATEDTRPMPQADNALLALNPATGQELWRFPVPAHSLSAPAVLNRLLFFTANNRMGYALDLTTGQHKWQVANLPSWTPFPPVAGDNAFYIGARAATLTAVNQTGQGRTVVRAPDDNSWFDKTPAYSGETIYASGWDRHLWAVDTGSGQIRWRVKTGRGYTSPPVVGDSGHLFIGVKEETKRTYSIQAINLVDGSVSWRFTAGRYFTAPPLIHDNLVFAACEDGRLYTLDATTGELVWQFPVADEKETKLLCVPTLCDEAVVIIDVKGSVSAVQWRQPAPLSLPTPSELREKGEWSEAGSVAALAGEYAAAAADFVQANQPYQAAQLYAQAADWNRAGDLYLKANPKSYPQATTRAVEAYRSGGNVTGEAQAHLAAKEFEAAAELFEQLKLYPQAANAYESAGLMQQAAMCHTMAQNYARAIEIYRALNDSDGMALVAIKQGDLDKGVAFLEDAGNVIRAAELLQQNGRAADAANLLEKHGYWEKSVAIWLQLKDRDGATAVYQRARQWEKAAGLWEELDLIRAAGLYRKANQLAKAARLYVKAGDLISAISLHKELGEMLKVAELAEKSQDYLGAAVAYLTSTTPKLHDAARCYVLAGKPDKAAECFEKAGPEFTDEAVKNWRKAGQTDRAVELLRTRRRLPEAARLLDETGQYLAAAEIWLANSPPNQKEAARLLRLGGDGQRALHLLVAADLWDEVRQVASELNDYEREAEACLRLAINASQTRQEELYFAAAQAFVRAAKQYEHDQKRQKPQLADLWETAAVYYQKALEEEQANACQQEIIRLREWPDLQVVITATNELVLDQYDDLFVQLKNVGHGTASMIFIRVVDSSFEGPDFATQHMDGLKKDRVKSFNFRVMPKKAGTAVPLTLEISYQLPNGEPRTRRVDGRVPVKNSDSQYMTPHDSWYGRTPSGGVAQVINIYNDGSAKVPLNIFGGQAQQIQGDNIAPGGQKGDKVEINRGDNRNLHLITDDLRRDNQDTENACARGEHDFDGSQFCRHCGKSLDKA